MSAGIDIECIALCDAINLFPGIQTLESCCGHGEKSFRIWFSADNLEALPTVLYYFDGCHCSFYGWHVVATTDCGMSPVKFMVEGPIGKDAYQEAKVIAKLMTNWIKEKK